MGREEHEAWQGKDKKVLLGLDLVTVMSSHTT